MKRRADRSKLFVVGRPITGKLMHVLLTCGKLMRDMLLHGTSPDIGRARMGLT